MSVHQQNESELLQGAQDSLNRHIYEFLNAAALNGTALTFAKECQACIVTPHNPASQVGKPPPVVSMMPSPACSNSGGVPGTVSPTGRAAEGPGDNFQGGDPGNGTALGQWWKTFWDIFNASSNGNTRGDATELAAMYYNIMCDENSAAGVNLVDAATAVVNGDKVARGIHRAPQRETSPSASQIFTPLKYTTEQKQGSRAKGSADPSVKRSTQWEIDDISPGALVVSTIRSDSNGKLSNNPGRSPVDASGSPGFPSSLQFENVSFSNATSVKFVDAAQANHKEPRRRRLYAFDKHGSSQSNKAPVASSTSFSSSSGSSLQPLTTTFQTTGWVKQFSDHNGVSKPLKKKSAKRSATSAARTHTKPKKFEFSTAADPGLTAAISKRRNSAVSARGKSKKPLQSTRSSRSSSSSHLTSSGSSSAATIHTSMSAVSLPTQANMHATYLSENRQPFQPNMDTPQHFKEEDDNSSLSFLDDIMGKPISLEEEYSNSYQPHMPQRIADYSYGFKQEYPENDNIKQYISSGASTVGSDGSGLADSAETHIDFHHIAPQNTNTSHDRSLPFSHREHVPNQENRSG